MVWKYLEKVNRPFDKDKTDKNGKQLKEETGTVAVAEQPSTLSGWTQEAERIYTLVDTAQKQSIQNGNSVAQVDLGDKPNFDEKATRSFIDKLNTRAHFAPRV